MSFRLKRSITTADLDLHDQAHCDCQACARARRQNAVTRSKDYWLENDTVVVQVERTLYKLSRGWLIRKSDYFRNLLKDHPASPDVGAKRLIVDANIVYVVEAAVSSHDFEQLLVCIDKGLEYAFSLPSFLQVASVLRAATALSFPIPLAFARRAMEVMWSSDLDKLTDTPLQYAALAVRLAHKYELGPKIRKRALYELLRREDYAQTEPWLKHHGRSESFRDLIPPSATADGNPEDSSHLHFISQEDLILLILVRQHLQSEWYTMTMSPRGIPDSCENAINGCKAPLEHQILWNKVAKALETLRIALVDPLKGLQRIRGYDWEGEGYCDICVTAVKCWCADEQVRLWTLLDGWFCANTGSAAADGHESDDGDNAEQDQEHASDI